MSRTGLTALAVLLTGSAVIGCASVDSDDAVPSPRSGFALAFDQVRSELVLFGGSDSSNVRLNDTWIWDGTTWNTEAAEGPPARSDAFVAYDAARGETVVFGGLTDDGLSGDTWTWNGNRWRLADTLGPSPRQLGMMAFDAATQSVVLFGGSGPGRERLGDTWTWDGSSWTEIETLEAPTPRGAHQMSYDPVLEGVLMTGGWDGTSARDTWLWKADTWSLIDSTGTPPRLHGSMVYDTERQETVLFGGFGESGRENSVWTARAGTWSPLDLRGVLPDIRAEHDIVYHPEFGVLMFGGIVGDGMALEDRIKSNELWSLRGSVWTRH